QRPDLLLLDLNMPHLDGFGVMRQLAGEYPAEDSLPILVLTADISVETKRRALSAGATDFLTKPFDPVEVILRINNLLRTRRQHVLLSDQKGLLEEAVRGRTRELEDTLARLRDTQGRMVQQERLSALGSMTAGIAHDFNNVLSLILGYSEMLRRSLAQPDGAATADLLLGTVITAAQDAARMFGRLREFYRPADQGQPRKMVDLNALVEQAAALTRPKWHGQALGQGATIRLRTELCPGLPLFLADAAELREMLTNLIFNAVDALPQGGEILLRTRAAGREEVALEVRDTGTGMDEETRRRCLEPFFTTKGQKGTGLGLAMVYGTMQRHGGRIDLQSSPGLGTTFSFYFPAEVKAPETAATAPADAHHSLSILTVDDQPVLCEILAEHLTEDWHTVEMAADGREALEKFRAKAGEHPYDLVITDRAMPNMNGEQLAAAIKAMAPDTRVILLTGYGATNDGGLLPANIDMVVDKPVTRQALREAVARVMAENHQEASLVEAV
ncbi:MAG: response regulator, partial [Gluconacetobacter diazotrophicus]|nr:response regulator [Gluconacetobacter diazotrophicus]